MNSTPTQDRHKTDTRESRLTMLDFCGLETYNLHVFLNKDSRPFE